MVIYHCKHCGHVLLEAVEGMQPECCGEPMEVLEANTKDAAKEKHVPSVKREGNVVDVQVGTTLHPMTTEHLINWIAVEQGNALQMVTLKAGEEPKAHFNVEDGAITVYAYCNLHGLWKAEA